MARLELIVFVALGCACQKKEHLLDRVEFSGCREVLVGPICEIEEEAKLVLWVKAKDAELTLSVDDHERPATWTAIDGGRRADLTVSPEAREIELVAKKRGVDRWRLPIQVWRRPDALRASETLFRAGKLDESEAMLAKVAPGDARIEGDRETMKARLASARGDVNAAIEHLQKAAAHGDREGVLSKSVNDRLSVVYWAIFSAKDPGVARRTLEEVGKRKIDDFALGVVNHAYYEGVLAKQSGDYRTALRSLAEAERRAERVNLVTAWRFAVQNRADAFAAMGMHQKALDHLAKLGEPQPGSADGCSNAYLLSARAWLGLMLEDAGGSTKIDTAREAMDALELFSGACPQPVEIPNILVNTALALVHRGDVNGAFARVAQARTHSSLTSFVMLWLLEVEARIELRKGNHSAALAAYKQLEELAHQSASPDGEWRACAGRAAVLAAMGQPVEALAAYTKAESLLETQSLSIAIGGARSSFLAARNRTVEAHVDLLVRETRFDEANAVIRRARARVLSGLEKEVRLAHLSGAKRAKWEATVAHYRALRDRLDESVASSWRAADSQSAQLKTERTEIEVALARTLDEALSLWSPAPRQAWRDPEPGEVILGFHRVPRGWVCFAVDAEGSQLERIAYDGADHAALLAPFDEKVAKSSRVRFLTDGPLANVDFHAVPFRGAPLLRTHVVTYAVDVPRPAMESVGESAVVVADPLGDLPAARDEAAEVKRRLDTSGVRATLLSGREATRRVLLSMMNASLLHYAGHGRAGGEGGWESALPLFESELSVGDILALDRVPREVVLSGCETAETSELAGQQLGLAQAFVLAGSRAVVAAVRPVRDDLARMMSEALYAERTDLPAALRAAQLTVMERAPGEDWAAFRAVVP